MIIWITVIQQTKGIAFQYLGGDLILYGCSWSRCLVYEKVCTKHLGDLVKRPGSPLFFNYILLHCLNYVYQICSENVS